MDNIETFHNKKTVDAETGGFTAEADLFKSVPMFLGFGCHGQHWDASQSEMGVAETARFRVEGDLF